jgi:chromosome segregation ATPase
MLDLLKKRQLSEEKSNQLWELIGATKTRLDNGDKQFDEFTDLMKELKSQLETNNTTLNAVSTRLDKHLTLHKYFNRIVTSVFAGVIAWWKS